jgi:hypothetical protein
MRRTLCYGVILYALLGAVCSEPYTSAKSPTFPGPDQLRTDPAFTVLVDSTDISGDPLLVLGSQRSFAALKAEFASALQANGWEIDVGAFERIEQGSLGAHRGDVCVYHWNMAADAWGASWMRREASFRVPDFERQSSNYVTVFNVTLGDCP